VEGPEQVTGKFLGIGRRRRSSVAAQVMGNGIAAPRIDLLFWK
jgi:hypothetical protein